MPWVKLTDRIHNNEKIGAVSHDAFRLWVLSISYSNLNLTDGHIPAARAKILVALRTPDKTIAELVEAKLWHRASSPCASCLRQRAYVKADAIPSGGYVIHHYFGDPDTGETYQRTRWTVEAERARLRAAGRQGGLKSASTRSTQLNLPASPGEEADEADRSSSEVKPTGQPSSLSRHAQESKLEGQPPSSSQPPPNGKLTGQPRTPVPRSPVPVAIATRTPRAKPEPEIPDHEGDGATARNSSQGTRTRSIDASAKAFGNDPVGAARRAAR